MKSLKFKGVPKKNKVQKREADDRRLAEIRKEQRPNQHSIRIELKDHLARFQGGS